MGKGDPKTARTRRCPDFAAILRESSPDEGLTRQIIGCFADQMLGLAHRRCRDASLAEDAFQEAVRITLEALPQFRGDAALETWLHRLVVSACSRLRRGRKNDPRTNLPLESMPAAAERDDDAPDQVVRLMLVERLEILALALGEIAEPNRSLFLLHEGEEVPLAELATRFGLTQEGVKARLKRTRSTLRARLRKVAQGDEAI